MMQAMPVVMTIFFLGFPSGLVLYWLTNNVLTILQQGIYNHWKKQQNDKAAGSDEQDAKKARTQKGGKGSRRVAK
jgi:membrane protein insertase Oxa1/YidC/SpoIIIJ